MRIGSSIAAPTALLGLTGLAALLRLRQQDFRENNQEWRRLNALQPASPARFSPAMLEALPAPAQRFFRFAIAPDTPLWPVATITMEGHFGMGSKSDPKYQPMRARQILAAPHGFVWQMKTTGGLPPMSGADTAFWTRFRIFGLIPVARMGGDPDHRRAAFGRHVAEALFWSPAALLPSVAKNAVKWQPVDKTTARVTINHQGLEQSVEIDVAASGEPSQVRFQRWTNANPQKRYQLQPFGGIPSRFQTFQGYRLPTHVEAGNNFGTPDYFPFFRVNVTAIDFPPSP